MDMSLRTGVRRLLCMKLSFSCTQNQPLPASQAVLAVKFFQRPFGGHVLLC